MSAAGVYVKAAKLVNDGWIKGALALDPAGRQVTPLDEEACMFCASGAIIAAVGDEVEADSVLTKFHQRLPLGYNIPSWNDHPARKQGEVVAELLRAAADAAEKGA